jgi:hypothetical protein
MWGLLSAGNPSLLNNLAVSEVYAHKPDAFRVEGDGFFRGG